MNKKKAILIPLLAISVVLILGFKGFGWENNLQDKEITRVLSPFITPESPEHEAWQVFQNYLEFARVHNLLGVKSLSYQISATCSDPSKEKECFALMDSVYAIASPLKFSEFNHVQMDERQIIMYTDGPDVIILYFTRDKDGTPKILGMRVCREDKTAEKGCVETDPSKRDLDNNGWWDSVESLFYK